MRVGLLWVLLSTILPFQLLCQEQTIKVSGFSASIPKSDLPESMDKIVCARTALASAPSVTEADVKALRAMLESLSATKDATVDGVVIPGQKRFDFASGDIAIIHLANWQNQDIKSQIWLTMSKDGRWLRQNTVDTRLFGKHRVVLVFVHSGLTVADPIVYNITATKKTPENIQHVIELGKAIASGTLGAFDDPKTSCAWGFSSLNINSVPSDVNIQAFSQKPVAHVSTSTSPIIQPTLLKNTSTNAYDQVRLKLDPKIASVTVCHGSLCTDAIAATGNEAIIPASLCGLSTCVIKAIDTSGKALSGDVQLGPIDSVTTSSSSAKAPLPDAPSVEAKAPEIGSKKFNNEDLYWWDVSLMLQVKSVNDIQYNAADGTVQPAKITKEDVFAAVDLFPFRSFERHLMFRGQYIRVPFSAAIPLNSKPLDRPFFGIGLGTKDVQFMAGVSYSSITAPTTLLVGQATTPSKLAANSDTHRVAKLMLGLNVSVTSVVKVLTKAK